MLKGKTALVTGCTAGLGFATVRELAAEGVNVMMNGFIEADQIDAKRAAVEKEFGIKTAYHGADLTQFDQIEDLVNTTKKTFGSVDILINNAVFRNFASIPEMPLDGWNRAMAVNVTAPFLLTKLILPLMRETGFGRIVNMCSTMSLFAQKDRSDYVTTKTALLGLTRATAYELMHDDDITCNGVCPGSIYTSYSGGKIKEMAAKEGISEEEATKIFLKGRQPSLRFIPDQHVAKLIVFLCGPHAQMIKGSGVVIDDGWHVT